MTKYFITGATGFIGSNLVRKLLTQNKYIHLLIRTSSDISGLDHPNITLFKGDITDIKSVEQAMKGCKYVIHLAAYAKIWPPDKQKFEQINYNGTVNVIESAIKCNIEKIIIISTAGVFGPSGKHKSVQEDTIREIGYFNSYEETKSRTDKYILEHYASKIKLLILCPTRVFGPGILNDSNSVTKLIKAYYKRKRIFLPGNGNDIGNYVYIDDVTNGIILALESSISGERFILGGENVSFNEFFDKLSELTGINYKRFYVSLRLISFVSWILFCLGKMKIINPPIIPAWTRRYFYDWRISSNKAIEFLNYRPYSLKQGLELTLKWLKKQE